MVWLDRYVSPGSGSRLTGRVHAHRGRSVATDRRCLLAADDPTASFAPIAETAGPGVGRDTTDCIANYLDHPAPADAPATTLEDLWFWLDRLERVGCTYCRHTGIDPDSPRPCPACDGDGWHVVTIDPDAPDAVTVAGVPLDRNRLCWWLPGELAGLGGVVRYWPYRGTPDGNSPAVVFDGGGWRLLVMGLNRSFWSGSYRTYYPGAGLWWHLRGDPVARLAAADWYADRGVEAANLFTGA